MDSDLARMEDDRRERLRALARSSLLGGEGGSETPRAKIMRFKLAARKPGIKQLLGGNPLADEEFNELEKYFRLSRERV